MKTLETLHDLIKKVDAQIQRMNITLNFLKELQPLATEKIAAQNAESLTELLAHFQKTQNLITTELFPQILALLDNQATPSSSINSPTINWGNRLGKRNMIKKRQAIPLDEICNNIPIYIEDANKIITNWDNLRERCVEFIREKLK